MKLWKTDVSIYKEKRYSFEKDSFTQEEVEVLGENEKYLCINDNSFTTVQRDGKAHGYDVLEKPHIIIEDGGGFLGSSMTKGIFYRLYSSNKKRPATVKKEIKNAIKKKYGWIADMNLDIIK